jgi:hypothetical protein
MSRPPLRRRAHPHGPALLLLVALTLLLTAAPALAHPFGPPPTALLRAVEDRVLIDWRAAPDDTAAIGVQLGFMEEHVLDAYLEAPTQAAPSAADEDALAASPELRAYLLERVVIRQDGEPCEVEVVDTTDFVHAGARIGYRCPAPVTAVEVELALLHDVHEAYRTFGIAEDEATVPAQAVFTSASPRQQIDFSGTAGVVEAADGDAGGEGGGGLLPGLLVLGGIFLVGALAAVGVAGRGSR